MDFKEYEVFVQMSVCLYLLLRRLYLVSASMPELFVCEGACD